MDFGKIIMALLCLTLLGLGIVKLSQGDNTWGVIFGFIGLMNLIRLWKGRKSQ